METSLDLAEVAASLGLDQRNGDVFYGKRRGYFIGFKVVNPVENPLVLAHVRISFGPDAPEIQSIRYPDAIETLRRSKDLEIEFGDRLAWITYVDGARLLFEGKFASSLDSILDAFTSAGLGRAALTCFHCRREPVTTAQFSDGKTAVICPACLQEKLEAPENRPAEATEGAIPIGALAPIAAGIGTVGWAGFWIVFALGLESFQSDTIYIPHIVEVALLLAAGFVTGAPVGFLFRRVQRRGRRLSIGLSAFASLAAVVIGEVGFVTWLLYRQFHVFSPSAAWELLPQIELELGGFHLAIKILAGILAIGIAIGLAKPSKPQLKL